MFRRSGGPGMPGRILKQAADGGNSKIAFPSSRALWVVPAGFVAL